jgi:hypothetical protein
MACRQHLEAMNAFNKCTQEQRKKEQDARSAASAARVQQAEREYEARRSALLQQIHEFMDTVRIGMTAAEADAAERESFRNSAGWGKTVNTTVTANGTTQQWVYRFSKDYGVNDMYVYLRDGVVFAIQK